MPRPYVVTVSSEKGGVGKTTVATNLAIFLKAFAEELPVTLLSFDNHFSVDRLFRIGRQRAGGHVGQIFTGTPLQELVEVGEFGVQFVPSCDDLATLRTQIDAPELLAEALAKSDLSGVIIIDTRPDLDSFTQNALFAADRVIVPVKDAPSLENCRHIYQFYEAQGLSRSALLLLPCLVDFRIRFEGPFKDPFQLIRAYAINRGYRCFDGCISKSPKVESLNTNPEGKIYPVLTHGQGTEVHEQFARLAEFILQEAAGGGKRRAEQVREDQERALAQRLEAFLGRRQRLQKGCLICGTPLVQEHAVAAGAAFYVETSDGRVAGYLDEPCFSELVFRHVFQAARKVEAEDPLQELFREAARRCYFVLRRAPHTRGFFRQEISFYRFDEQALEISHKRIELSGSEEAAPSDSHLRQLLTNTLFDEEGRLGEDFLVIRRVSSDFPEEILYDGPYWQFADAGAKIASQLP